MKTTKEGISKTTKLITEEEINRIISITDNLIDECIKNTIDGNFNINPKRIDNDLIGCTYCKFKDLCYMREENIVDIEKKKIEDILEGDIL